MTSLLIVVMIIALTSVVLLEIAIYLLINDLSIPSMEIPEDVQNILIIYPHPDDEILTAGGLMKKYADKKNITWVVLSRGERGTPDASVDDSLKVVRTSEANRVASMLGIAAPIFYDFKDNEMESERDVVKSAIKQIVEDKKPDLIITYDLSGLYGHPDHIVTSEIVTQIARDKDIRLWYATNSKRVLDMVALPEHMATDPEFKERRTYPTHKLYVGLSGSIAKARGVSLYKSQSRSFRSAYPTNWMPLAVFQLPTVYEYFCEVG